VEQSRSEPDVDEVEWVASECGVSQTDARRLMAASEPLWDVLASLGWTDTYGGTEWKRILPAALLGIRKLVNVGVNTNASYLGFEVTPGEDAEDSDLVAVTEERDKGEYADPAR
jgi:hypothetical protein